MTRSLEPGRGAVNAAGRDLETFWLPPIAAGRPSLVLLHEGLGSVGLWRDFPQKLGSATGCGVLAYSRWGNGRSEVLEGKRPIDYMHHEGEVVVPAVLDALGIEKPILIGHSDGASIALLYAAAVPDGPAALILEAPHVFVEDFTIAGITAAKTAYETTDLRQKLARHHTDVDRTFWGWNEIWLDPRFRPWNIEAALPRIRCPILVIQGEDDEYGTTAQLDAIRQAAPQTETLLLPACRHTPHREQEAATLAAMTRFLDQSP